MTVIDAPPLPPPAIVTPAPREVSFGRVQGTVPAGTRRVLVRIGERVLADRPLRGRRFSLRVRLPAREVTVRVTALDGGGRRSFSTVGPVLGLPAAALPGARTPTLDPVLADRIRALAGRHGGTSGIYVQDLRTGRGAAWNARARFPAASTLKLAIAVAVLASLDGTPAEGSRLAALLERMLVVSDNRAANELEVWLGGSTLGGSDRVNATMRALGLHDSHMYGGYETRRPAAVPIPIRVEAQPDFGVGKYTTAWDLARLARAVYLAAAGGGPLPRLGVSRSESRHLLWLLARAGDRGKLDRYLGEAAVVMHKAGWLPEARHDAGLVASEHGVFVAAVLTWRASAPDELAGRVALTALQRLGSKR